MNGSPRSSCSVKPSAVAKLASSDFQRADRGAGGMAYEEIKESDQQLLQKGAGLGAMNLKKVSENFVSSTMAAASRKKKILAEKNDAPPSECSGTYSEGNPGSKKPGQSHGHPVSAPQAASFPSGPRVHRSGEETVVSSETQPYDPLTNYLSPRPKFLRYNPSRRREIYLRRERELKGAEGSSGLDLSGSFEVESASSEGTPPDPPASPSMKHEGSDVKSLQDKGTREDGEEEEDEEEEVEEERPSCCDPVWKSLLLLGLLFFSTCYISSVHPSSAVSSLQNFHFSKGSLFKIQDSYREVAENVGTLNLDRFVGTYMNACMQGQFDKLVNWGNGINSNRLDGLLKFGDRGEGKRQDEGNVKEMWAANVDSNLDLVMIEGRRNESGESQHESEMANAEDSGVLMDHIPVVAEGEKEYAGNSKETQDGSEMVRPEDSFQIGVENEESFDIAKVFDPEHGNGFSGAVTYEQHAEDVIMETGTEETDDVTEPLIKTAPSPQKENVSDHEEEKKGALWPAEQEMNLENKRDTSSASSLPDTVEDAGALRFYRFKLFTTVLVLLTVAASTIVGFLSFRKQKTSVEHSSATFPSSDLEAEGGGSSQLSKMGKTGDMAYNFFIKADQYKGANEKLPPAANLTEEKEDKHFSCLLVDADKYKEVNENRPPAVKLVEEKFVDPFVRTDKYREPYERNPPAVKLLGEFSVSDQGISGTKNASLRKKTMRIEEHPLLPQEMSMRKNSPFAEQADLCSSGFPTPESASSGTPAQEELMRKHKSGHRQEAAKVASTPARRSSRIRNKIASPVA